MLEKLSQNFETSPRSVTSKASESFLNKTTSLFLVLTVRLVGVSLFLMLESMLCVRDLLDQIALANESLLLLNSEWVAIHELTESLKPVHEAAIAIQLNKLTAGEFFGEWLKCKIQLQRSVSAISEAMLHAIERRETALLSNAAFIAAIYVDPRYQVL